MPCCTVAEDEDRRGGEGRCERRTDPEYGRRSACAGVLCFFLISTLSKIF